MPLSLRQIRQRIAWDIARIRSSIEDLRVIERRMEEELVGLTALIDGEVPEPEPDPPPEPIEDPPATDAPHPHQPDGHTTLLDVPLDRLWHGWESGVLMNGNEGFLSLETEAPPGGRTTYLRNTYPAGYPAGEGVGKISHEPRVDGEQVTLGDGDELYMSLQVRYSENYSGHGANNKIAFVWYDDSPGFVLSARGSGDGPLTVRAALQHGQTVSHESDAEFVRGRWHHVEVLLRTDGTLVVWLDGALAIDRGDAPFDVGRGFHIVAFAPIWGGVGGVVPVEQSLDIGEFYVSGRVG